MKKLLLYLMVFLGLGTTSDAFATWYFHLDSSPRVNENVEWRPWVCDFGLDENNSGSFTWDKDHGGNKEGYKANYDFGTKNLILAVWYDEKDHFYVPQGTNEIEIGKTYTMVDSGKSDESQATFKIKNGVAGADYGFKISLNNKVVTLEVIGESQSDPTPSGSAELYLGGEPAGGWAEANWKKDDFKLKPTGNPNEYSIRKTILANQWFTIYDGSNNQRYIVKDEDRFKVRFPLESTDLNTTNEAMKFEENADHDVVITVLWDGNNKKISFANYAETVTDFTGSVWSVSAANNGWSYQRWDIEKVANDVNVYKNGVDGEQIHVNPDDKWISMTKGYEDRGFDGLALGLDNFLISTRINSRDAARIYWATENVETIIPGRTYPLVSMSLDDAKGRMKIDPQSGNNKKQDRYDVIFNWEDKTMIVVPNAKWESTPDNMYLWREFPGEGGVAAPDMMDNFSDTYLAANPHIIKLVRDGSGNYVTEFEAAQNDDMPKGTKVTIFGGTGVRYKVAGAEVYKLTSGEWNKISNLQLENDVDNVGYFLIDTDEMENTDYMVTVNPNINGNVHIRFTKLVAAPVKWYLKEQDDNTSYTADGTEYEMTKNANGSFTLDTNLLDGKHYTLIAEFADGTKDHYAYKCNENGNDNTNNNYWVKGTIENVALAARDKNIRIDTKSFNSAKARLTLNWRNGNPTLRIANVPRITKKVRVYFVDRAGWGDIHCYNYTDGQVTETTGAPDSDQNAAFPGVGMTELTSGIVKDVIDTDARIYQIDLDVAEYEDGTYDRPKVIFAKEAKKQTENLYLVDGGIYTNASPANAEGLVEYPATEYLPRMQFNYMDPPLDQEVMTYPNDFYSTEYNVIYVDDKKMVDHVKSGNIVSVDLRWDRNGNGERDFIATGLTGLHHMSLVKIGNKELIRVQFASDVVPNNTPVDLGFWFGNNKDDLNKGKDGHNDTPDCYQHCEMNGVSYDGEHFTCYDSYCSLNFTNVMYADGNVYRRYYADENGTPQQPVISIRDLVTPEHLYLVNKGSTEDAQKAFAYAEGKNLLTKQTKEIDGVTYTLYELQPDRSLGEKLGYTVPQITKDAQFDFIVYYKDDPKAYYYSGTKVTPMRPGNLYQFFNRANQSDWYDFTVNSSYTPNALSYDLLIEWNESCVSLSTNKSDANVQIAVPNGDGTYDPVDLDGAVYELLARSDEFQTNENEQGKPYSYDKIYFFVDSAYTLTPVDEGENAGKELHEVMTAQIIRDADYEKYFRGNTKNVRAHFAIDKEEGKDPGEVHEVPEDSYEIVGINLERQGDENTPSLMSVRVVTHTANTFVLRLRQKESNGSYARAAFNIPVRVYPTPKSVGLIANNQPVEMVDPGNKNSFEFKVAIKKGGDHTDSANGNIFRDGKIQFQCQEATESAKNGNTHEQYIKFFWAYDESSNPETLSFQRIPSILRAATSDLASSDEDRYGSEYRIANGLTDDEWSSDNTPQFSAKDEGTSKRVKLQIQQNGINSPIYNLTISDDPNINTGVEGIEAADAVVEYYDLNGLRVANEDLVKGIYVKVTNGKAEKVVIR